MTMQLPTPIPLPTLADFFEAVRASNPFLVNRVDRPLDDRLIDVDTIHEAAFKKIVALGQQAQRDNRGIGVTVWGEAGVGKSHLLARLGRWALNGPKAVYAYLHNLQASSERLPRYVLRVVLNAMTAGQADHPLETTLFDLLNQVMKKALGRPRGVWEEIATAYRRWLRRQGGGDSAGGALFDQTVYEVLFRFYRAAHPRGPFQEEVTALAVRWLAGDTLDDTELGRLGVRGEGNTVALADNQHVKQVLVALAQLARAGGRLVLLGFDQVDNLEEGQVKGLSRFLHDLLDSVGNLLIVTTGVRQTLLGYLQRGVITETSWDRLGQFDIVLGRLRREQGQALLRARLQKFLGPFRGVVAIEEQLRADPLFPLSSAWFSARLHELPDFRPRDLIGWACDRWQRLQEDLLGVSGTELLERWTAGNSIVPPIDPAPPPPPPLDLEASLDRAVAQQLAQHKTECLRDPSPLVVDEDHLVGLLDALLRQCLGPGRAYPLQDYHRDPVLASTPRALHGLTLHQRLASDAQPLRIRVRVLIRDNAGSSTAALRHLLADETPSQRVLLVTVHDHFSLGQKGAKQLEQLRDRGQEAFRHLEISLEQYAELDALQAVVLQARARDFEFEPAPGQRRTATEEDVVASHHRAHRYLAHPLLREFLGGENTTASQSVLRAGDEGAVTARQASAILSLNRISSPTDATV